MTLTSNTQSQRHVFAIKFVMHVSDLSLTGFYLTALPISKKDLLFLLIDNLKQISW